RRVSRWPAWVQSPGNSSGIPSKPCGAPQPATCGSRDDHAVGERSLGPLTLSVAPRAVALDAHLSATAAPPLSAAALPGLLRATPSIDPDPAASPRATRSPGWRQTWTLLAHGKKVCLLPTKKADISIALREDISNAL